MIALPVIPQEEGVIINYFNAFKWRWLTDDPIRWHVCYLIDFARNGQRFVILSGPMIYAHGVTGDKCDRALKIFIGQFEASRDTKHPNQEKAEIDACEITVPDLIPFPNDSKFDEDAWVKDLWDAERTYYGEKPETVSTSFTVKIGDPAPAQEEPESEEDEEHRRFNEWLAKKTEFTREEFYSQVRQEMSQYEVEERKLNKSNSTYEEGLMFVGKTAPYRSCRNEETADGKIKFIERYVNLNYVGRAVYQDDCCHIGFDCDGHDEHFGTGVPVKTKEDLSAILWAMGQKHLKRKPVQRYQQMSLFDFI